MMCQDSVSRYALNVRGAKMKKHTLNHILYVILQLTWGIVQNALGVLLWLILTLVNPRRKRGFYHGAVLTYWKFSFSMGLGMFIFYGHEGREEEKEVLVHEWGHTIQSIILGPLFFLVIAIPSTVWAFTPVFGKWRREGRYRYTDLYCEKWANLLGERLLKEPSTWR